jgi:hypothetical protein
MKEVKGNMNDAINQLVLLTVSHEKRDQKQKAVEKYLKEVKDEKTA